MQQAIQFQLRVTNSKHEYEAVLAEFRLAKSLKVRNLFIFSDFELVVKQIRGEYEAWGARKAKYLAEVKAALLFYSFVMVQII